MAEEIRSERFAPLAVPTLLKMMREQARMAIRPGFGAGMPDVMRAMDANSIAMGYKPCTCDWCVAQRKDEAVVRAILDSELAALKAERPTMETMRDQWPEEFRPPRDATVWDFRPENWVSTELPVEPEPAQPETWRDRPSLL